MTTPEQAQPDGGSRRWIDLNLALTMHLPAISMGFGLGATTVVLPGLTQDLGQTFFAAMLVFILQQLGTAVAPIPTGFLVDKIGRRKMLLAGPLVIAASSLLIARAAVVGSFEEVLVFRFFSGVGEQMWMLSRITVISETGRAQQRGKQITSMFGVQQVGTLTGPLVGGVTADYFGNWVPFVLQAVVVTVAMVPSFFLVKETLVRQTAPRPGDASGAAVPQRRLSMADLRTPPIPQVFAAQFLANVTRGGIFGGGVILTYAVFAYGMSDTAVGFLRSIMAVAGIPVTFTAGYVMDRFGRKYTIVPGLGLSGLSMLFLASTDLFNLPIGVFIAAFASVHLSINIVSGNLQTLSTDIAPAHARGSFFGVSRLMAQSGSLASPTGFALFAQFVSYAAAFTYLGTAALAGSAVVGLLITETLRKEPPQAAEGTAGAPAAIPKGT